VRSKRLELSIRIEGGEPVTLHALTVHAAPDTLARLYENGMVLQPASHPFSFDLSPPGTWPTFQTHSSHSSAGRRANTGAPVGASVDLGPKDGLFPWNQ